MDRSYAIRIFDEQERSHLAAVVRSVLARGKDDWVEKTAAEASVIMVSPDEPGAQTLIDRLASHATRVALVYSDSNPGKSPWWLKKPATSGDVEKLFVAIARFLTTASQDAGAHADSDHADAHETQGSGLLNLLLLNRLRSELRKNGSVLMRDGVLLAHGIDAVNGRVHLQAGAVDSNHAPDLYRQAIGQINAANANTVVFESLVPSQLEAFRASPTSVHLRLDGYLWHLGRAVNGKSLLEKSSRSGAFRLQRWPDLVGADYTQEELRLCAMAARFPVTASLLKSKLGVDDACINGFINACHMMGIVELMEARDNVTAIGGTRFSVPRNILSRLLTKLSA